MKHSYIRQVLFPVIAAMIWGAAFVSQSISADFVGPYTFNTLRSVIAAAVLGLLLIGIKIFKKYKKSGRIPEQASISDTPEVAPVSRKKGLIMLILGGFLCGTVLTAASNLQQLGLAETPAGKAGFITALYIVIVPILGLFLRKKVTPLIIGSVALAAAGLYFLCIDGSLTFAKSDVYVILCAVSFSFHILLIDYFTRFVDGIALSFAQFITVTFESGIFMLLTEQPSWTGIMGCFWQIMYVGVFSSAVAYTLQILAQKGSNPTVVSLILSLESVFATIAGAIFLHEIMEGREYFGCVLMLVAVVLAQLPAKLFRRRGNKAVSKV
jgi:drug/metabolite transporter (DMT)-like permease